MQDVTTELLAVDYEVLNHCQVLQLATVEAIHRCLGWVLVLEIPKQLREHVVETVDRL